MKMKEVKEGEHLKAGCYLIQSSYIVHLYFPACRIEHILQASKYQRHKLHTHLNDYYFICTKNSQ